MKNKEEIKKILNTYLDIIGFTQMSKDILNENDNKVIQKYINFVRKQLAKKKIMETI